MNTGKKIFAVRDVSRALIAFGILIIVLNLNHYLLVYILGIFTLIMGVLNLFSLNLWIKLIGALNMALAGIYFILSAVLLYYRTFGLLGTLVMFAMGLLLLVLSLRFIFYYLQQNRRISF
jgi:hypothetical protein